MRTESNVPNAPPPCSIVQNPVIMAKKPTLHDRPPTREGTDTLGLQLSTYRGWGFGNAAAHSMQTISKGRKTIRQSPPNRIRHAKHNNHLASPTNQVVHRQTRASSSPHIHFQRLICAGATIIRHLVASRCEISKISFKRPRFYAAMSSISCVNFLLYGDLKL